MHTRKVMHTRPAYGSRVIVLTTRVSSRASALDHYKNADLKPDNRSVQQITLRARTATFLNVSVAAKAKVTLSRFSLSVTNTKVLYPPPVSLFKVFLHVGVLKSRYQFCPPPPHTQ